MSIATLIADSITATRALLGLLLVGLGSSGMSNSLPLAILIAILCWTGDALDGSVARLAQGHKPSMIGKHDLAVDVLVSFCMGAYLITAEFIPISVGVWYLLGWGALFYFLGLDHILFMLVQVPSYLAFILVSLVEAPHFALWILVWLLLITALLWQRFTRQVIPNFLREMRELTRHDRR